MVDKKACKKLKKKKTQISISMTKKDRLDNRTVSRGVPPDEFERKYGYSWDYVLVLPVPENTQKENRIRREMVLRSGSSLYLLDESTREDEKTYVDDKDDHGVDGLLHGKSHVRVNLEDREKEIREKNIREDREKEGGGGQGGEEPEFTYSNDTETLTAMQVSPFLSLCYFCFLLSIPSNNPDLYSEICSYCIPCHVLVRWYVRLGVHHNVSIS